MLGISSVQFSSIAQPHLTLCDPMECSTPASLFIINSQSLLKPMSIKLVMPSNHLILCHHLLLPPSISPSIRVFSNESAFRIRWPKYWSFSLSNSPSNGYSGLIPLEWAGWISLLSKELSKNSQESSPTPQFKSISSLVLSFLYRSSLISKHDHWKKQL